MLQPILYILVFLLCVVLRARVLSRSARQIVLLSASLGLYLTWAPWFATVLLTSAIANFGIGLWLRRKQRGSVLLLGVVINLILLGVFKYLPEIAVGVSVLHWFLGLALPLGISFWTFQALSYLFDLYQGEELDPSLSEFILYMAFFPVAVAGPVCRLAGLLPQFRSAARTTSGEIVEGFRRIAIGVLMIQIAKLLGQGILAGDGIISGFDLSTHWSGTDVWCLAFGYGLQLFFDFAGYSHVAIGTAKAMGLVIPENFAQPFKSPTPAVFWTRWHMSLSFWIRDYFFFPFMQLRRETWWRNLALLFSMALFGIWHRASLLFLLWGCYHGMLLVLHRRMEALELRFDWNPPPALWTPLSWITTASLISVGWILFRANSETQALEMLSTIITPTTYKLHYLSSNLYILIATVATGYAIVTHANSILDRYSRAAQAESHALSRTIVLLARWRWFWLPAAYVLTLIFVLLATLTQQGGVGQMMYRSF